MLSTSDELNNAIKVLQNKLSRSMNEENDTAVRSRTSYCHFHMSLAEYYSNAVDVCSQYFTTLNLSNFVNEMIQIGFISELYQLRQFIDDPQIVQQINSVITW